MIEAYNISLNFLKWQYIIHSFAYFVSLIFFVFLDGRNITMFIKGTVT